MGRRLFNIFLQLFFVLLLLLGTTTRVVQAQEEDQLSGYEQLELQHAMEMFMRMSAKERESAIKDLMAAVGDDPKAKKEMETLLEMLPNLEDDSNLSQLIAEDELAKAKHEAKRQMSGQSFEDLWANQEAILEEVLASGQLAPEDAARFKTDPDAWKATLKLLYDDVLGGKDEL
jgi:aminopeptidase N